MTGLGNCGGYNIDGLEGKVAFEGIGAGFGVVKFG